MLLIYSANISNRLKYVLQHIFYHRLGIEFVLTNDLNEYRSGQNIAKFSYGYQRVDDKPFFFACPLLNEDTIDRIDLKEGTHENIPALFIHHNKDSALDFDIFAAVFYILSRYEEYVYDGKDQYGNFDFKESILYRLNTLNKPVVDQWINLLKNVLLSHFPQIKFKKNQARYILTFDIDVAYAYLNRSFIRTVLGIGKKILSLNVKALKDQILTLLHVKEDMFDTYSYIKERTKGNTSLFFFNMGHYGRYDKNPSAFNKNFQQLIRTISKTSIVGLHPSYASAGNQNLIAFEKKKLEDILGTKVEASRQHYLKLSIPFTYRALLDNGIKQDFTMGYYFNYGFRAGTCHPFLFFDLKKNEITELSLYPFVFMDGTLHDVLQISPAGAKSVISELLDAVHEFGGIFIPLWHNSTLGETDGWQGWRPVFEQMLHELEIRNFKNMVSETAH